jgi:type II secretory pathway pseudopilin PulG
MEIVRLRPRHMVCCRQGGFTFNEILVAMNVIAIAILGYSVSIVGIIQGNASTDNTTVAINLAQDKMEELRTQRSLVNDDRCPALGDRSITAVGGPNGIFDRCWRIIDSPLGTHLKQIDVTVSWQERGKREITITTLLYGE